jgi:hypothetical protein
MIEGLTLAFAVGLFVVFSPSAIAFALALVGLPLTRPLRAAAAMGACFAVVFALAAVVVLTLDLEWVLDVAAWVGAVVGAGLAVAGIRTAVSGPPRDRELSVVGYGTVFAIAALPSMLMIYEALLDQGAESAGAPAAVFLTIAFAAGCAAALALPALAAAALTGAGLLARRAAGLLVAAAGIWIVAYWLPALFGGRIERGGAVEDAANAVSGGVSEFAARYELGFALLLLAVSVAALAAAMRPRTR